MSEALKMAIAAGLPLITLTTRDSHNIVTVLSYLTKTKPIVYQPQGPVGEHEIHFVDCKGQQTDSTDWHKVYDKFAKAESSLLVINPYKPDPAMFNAGELPVPREVLMKFMTVVTDDEVKAAKLLPALGGCTIKEATELARLTMARDHSLTPQGIMLTRRSFFTAQTGLSLVDTKQSFYAPQPSLKKWMAAEKDWFLKGTDDRLVPRGLLFDGPPGTGKTAGAKWLAENLGVPLYRLDIGGTKSKYVGQSENNLLANLRRIDNEEPCVLLFDEVEKVFGHKDHDSGTSSTMLSQILWWLAEHKSRVLTIMTTNKRTILPEELYREGRIDEVMMMRGLKPEEVGKFVVSLCETFGCAVEDEDVEAIKALTNLDNGHYAHAAITKTVTGYLKKVLKPT